MSYDVLRNLIAKRKEGLPLGITSCCTANPLVIEAILEQARRFDDYVLIEATSNQVNQYGGYTNMQPLAFRDFVYDIARQVNYPKERIILGGDHLGPLIWADQDEKEAMEKASVLVASFVKAGYKKIHLDTSMRLADDDQDEILSTKIIARRGAFLYQVCEKAYQELLKNNPDEIRPVYIIGSEVPIPGGAQEAEGDIQVTSPEAVEETIQAYKNEFASLGYADAFDNIIGIVVQPGVEFGDDEIFHYSRAQAASLSERMKKYPDMVLEGHSTDYQSPLHLKEMVEDGIAILKVGPALTFALRESLFSLEAIERELVAKEKLSNFAEVLDRVMMNEPGNWMKHYHGEPKDLELKRKYSFSDRVRYYLGQQPVQESMAKLFANIDRIRIPISMLQQYMPLQYRKVRDGKLKIQAKDIAKDFVTVMIEDYNFAVKSNYDIGAMLR